MKHRILCFSLAAILAFSTVSAMPVFAENESQTIEIETQTYETETESEIESETVPAATDSETNESVTESNVPPETAVENTDQTTSGQTASENIQTFSATAADPASENTTEGFVRRLYQLILSREPDPTGLSEWTALLNSGNETGANIVSGFIHSDEFKEKNLSDTEYVSILYRTILNREPDGQGLNDWLGVLQEGFSRDYVCYGFIGSDEFKDLCSQYGIQAGQINLTDIIDLHPEITRFVNRLYELVLSRTPDATGRREWVEALVSKRNTAAVAALGFLDSNELKGKNLSDSDYLDILYRTLLDREPDGKGKSEWLAVVEMGVSRNYLIYNFVASPEFGDLCAQYGIDRGTITLTESRDQNKYITGFVKKAYETGLQRSPSVSDLNNWSQQLNAHTLSGKSFVESIVFSTEGKSKSTSDSDFVRLAYRVALLRDPSAADISNGTNILKSQSRESYLSSILNSSEFKGICDTYALPYNVEGWNQSSNGWYYVKNGAVLSGWQRINGSLYYLDSSDNNTRATGWRYVDGLKYYFDSNGILVQNVDSIIGKQSSYLLKVNTTTNTVSIYARDGANGYIIPVKNMICSCGASGTPTIKGTFTVRRYGRWATLMGPVYGQYVSQIYGGYLFHSAWYHVNGNNRTLSVSEYRKLGQNASHGCVRLTVGDAKWIYDNCNGSTVTIYSSSSMDNMFDKPSRPNPVVISGDYGYDPTDPAFN